MKIKSIILTMLVVLSLTFLGRCTDPWEERISLNDGVPASVLLDEIKSNADLSTFVGLLEKTGLDKELAASKTFTVWAPTNSAFENMSGTLPESDSLLTQFLLNHVSYERVNYDGVSETIRHKMANGKYTVLDTESRTINGVALEDETDNVAKNGVLHTISSVLEVKMNIWEYLEANATLKHADFILNQNVDIFDASIADELGVDATTGETIYDTISGTITINAYLENVVDINDEDELLTYFVFTDGALNSEISRFSKYYNKSTQTATDSLATWYILSDAAVEGELAEGDLGGVIVSIGGVSFAVDASSIEQTYDASNGVIYVVNALSVDITERVKPIKIEAEFPYPDSVDVFTQNFFREQPDVNDRYNLYTRAKDYASNGYDILFPSGHGLNPGYIDFIIDKVNTVKYQIYWVSAHEQTDDGVPRDTASFSQSLFNGILNYNEEEEEYEFITKDTIAVGVLPTYIANTSETDLGVLAVDTLNNYEVFYDDEGNTSARNQCIRLRVQGSGSSSPIALDYIKMVPIIE